MSSDGISETEVRRRVQAGANAWRQVEGVMSDRQYLLFYYYHCFTFKI